MNYLTKYSDKLIRVSYISGFLFKSDTYLPGSRQRNMVHPATLV